MRLKLTAFFASKNWRNKYDSVGNFHEGLARVELKRKWGFVNETGKVVIPLKYRSVGHFSKEGLALVMLNDKYGFINLKGEVVIPLKYYWVRTFSEGLVGVMITDKFGFINLKGKVVVPPKYHRVGNFHEGLAEVSLNCKCGFVNKTGEEICELKYDEVEDFSEGFAQVGVAQVGVGLKRKYGLINKEGKELLPPVFSSDKIKRYRNDPLKWVKKIKGLYETDPNGLMLTLNVDEKDYDWEGWYKGV